MILPLCYQLPSNYLSQRRGIVATCVYAMVLLSIDFLLSIALFVPLFQVRLLFVCAIAQG